MFGFDKPQKELREKKNIGSQQTPSTGMATEQMTSFKTEGGGDYIKLATAAPDNYLERQANQFK